MELHPALLDAVEEQLLALGAVLSLLPPAPAAAPPGERHVPAQQDVHDDAQRPHVALLVVGELLLLLVVVVVDEECVDDLGRHVLDAAHRGEQPRRTDVNVGGAAQVKVAELDGAGRELVDAEDVLGLDVPVRDPLFVQVGEGVGQRGDDGARFALCEAHALLDVGEQGAAPDLLEDEEEVVVLLEVLYELDDVIVAAAQVVNLNLLQNLK